NLEILLQEINKLKEKNFPYFRLCFLIAKEYTGLQNFEKAIGYYQECLNYPDQDSSFFINTVTFLIKLLALTNNWHKFESYSHKYRDIAANNPDFAVNYGVYLLEVKKDELLARRYFQQAINFKENKPDLLYEQASVTWKPLLLTGLSYFNRQDWQKAYE